MNSNCYIESKIFRALLACACSVVVFLFAGCGGTAAPASNFASTPSSPSSTGSSAPSGTSGSSSGGSQGSGSGSSGGSMGSGSGSSGSGSSSGSSGSGSSGSSGSGSSSGNSGGSGSGSSGSGSGGGDPTPAPAPQSTGFLYAGLNDDFSFYTNFGGSNSGSPMIAAYSIAADGTLTAAPGSPYQSPANRLAVAPSGSALYASSGSTLNVDSIQADGHLKALQTMSPLPLSPSQGIYTSLDFNRPADTIYATEIHGAGDNFFEFLKITGDSSLTSSGSMQAPVGVMPLSFTPGGARAYEPYCYHLDDEILGYTVNADHTLTAFNTKAVIPSSVQQPSNEFPCPAALAISPDGKYVAAVLNTQTTTPQGSLALYAVDSDGTLSLTSESPYARTAQADDLKWDASGTHLAIAAQDGLWIYNFAGGVLTPMTGMPLVTTSIDHLAFNKSGTLLFATSAASKSIYVFDFNSDMTITPAPGSPHKLEQSPYVLAVAEK